MPIFPITLNSRTHRPVAHHRLRRGLWTGIAVLIGSLALGGCGQKGPLVLPRAAAVPCTLAQPAGVTCSDENAEIFKLIA